MAGRWKSERMLPMHGCRAGGQIKWRFCRLPKPHSYCTVKYTTANKRHKNLLRGTCWSTTISWFPMQNTTIVNKIACHWNNGSRTSRCKQASGGKKNFTRHLPRHCKNDRAGLCCLPFRPYGRYVLTRRASSSFHLLVSSTCHVKPMHESSIYFIPQTGRRVLVTYYYQASSTQHARVPMRSQSNIA